MGFLLRHKRSFKEKWVSTESLELNHKLKLPPILIPSSGRATTALLDLNDAMEGHTYAEIVIIRREELESYLQICHSHKNIDLFVIQKGELQTIGTYRFFAKKFGEKITASTPSKFVFIQDDNILSWTGVTLINDPCPLFDKDPNCRFAQQTDISLFNLLSHFKSDDYKNVKDFSIIGFSLTKRKVKSRIHAYGRRHVFGAVLLNLSKLGSVQYNKKAWAMEDIDFNWKTNDLHSLENSDGLIVKCLRYVGSKKRINEGGVVPQYVPDEIQTLLANSKEWTYEQIKRKESEKDKNSGTSEAKNTSSSEFIQMKLMLAEMTQKFEQEEAKNKKLERENKENMLAKLKVEKENEELRKQNEKHMKPASGEEDFELNAANGSSSGSQAAAMQTGQNTGKRKNSKKSGEEDEVNKHKRISLEMATNGSILPQGLIKLEENKYQCENLSCNDCKFIGSPFLHFRSFRNKATHTPDCHLCSLYLKEDMRMVFEELCVLSENQEKRKKRKRK